MDPITAADVREWSAGGDPTKAFDFARFGYPAPTGADPDPLDHLVLTSIAYVEQMTGRVPLTALEDASLVSLAQDAVTLRVQQRVVGGGARRVEASAAGDGIQSFRAGDYQETRFKPEDRLKGRLFNPWDTLSEILWLLATPEKRDELNAMLTGVPRPAAVVVESDAGGSSVYGYGDF